MKILYLDLGMGAAGDMLTAALLDAMEEKEKEEAIKDLSALNIPDVRFDVEKSVKCGITGTHVSVKVHGTDEGEGLHEDHHGHHHEHDHRHQHEHDDFHEHGHGHYHEHDDFHEHGHGHQNGHDDFHEHGHDHEHHHSHASLEKINSIVDSLNVSDSIKSDIRSIYKIIATAEGHVHNKPITDIHFHEVGTMDAIADITAACILIRRIGADKIIASPIHVGSGQVRCAHGILPVPAPATAFILKGIPMYSTDIKGELCTPTGAAILKYFVDEFMSMPAMTSDSIGYGMGFKDFERANCVRAIIGHDTNTNNDSIIELRCNIDDMTGEELGYAFDKLLEAGARDVFTTPISMKKNRPGILLTVICSVSDRDMMVKNIFKHTTTIGIRENVCNRYILSRESETLNTPFGQVREKRVSGYGTTRSKLEYDDIAKIAKNTGMSIREVKDAIRK